MVKPRIADRGLSLTLLAYGEDNVTSPFFAMELRKVSWLGCRVRNAAQVSQRL